MLHTAPGGVVQHMTEGARDSPPDDTSYRSWPAPQVVRRLKWLAALCLIHGVDASCPRGHVEPYNCDELWERNNYTCALLIGYGWDCTGCNCPGDPSPPPPSPQQRPVECGRPGHCSEEAGLRDPDELHEVRACIPSCCVGCTLCACSPRPHPRPGALLLRRPALSSLAIQAAWLLCVGRVGCGLGVLTRQDLRRGRGHLPSRRREALHRGRACGRLHRRHWVSVRLRPGVGRPFAATPFAAETTVVAAALAEPASIADAAVAIASAQPSVAERTIRDPVPHG